MRVTGDNGVEIYLSDNEAIVTLRAANSRLKSSTVSLKGWDYGRRFAFLMFLTSAKKQIIESLELQNFFEINNQIKET